MSKDITKVTGVDEAIKELGNMMLDNTCIQFDLQYTIGHKDCIVKCNKQISDVLVNYIKERRRMEEEYITRSLSEQFDRTCYVLSASEKYSILPNRLSICFSKENLRVDLHDSDGRIEDAYFIDEKYYPSDCYGNTEKKYMNNCFKKIDSTIKYVKPEIIIEKPVVHYYISKDDLDIRKQIELFLKRDFNKIYYNDNDFIYDFYNDEKRIISLGHEKYNYIYKMPEIVKKHMRILVEELRTMAKDTYVTLFDEEIFCDEEHSLEEKMTYSRIPESLKEFRRITNCEFEIIEDFYILAFSGENTNDIDNDIASVRLKFLDNYEGWYDIIRIASCNEIFINDYFEEAIGEYIELHRETIEEMMIKNGFNQEQFLGDNKGKPTREDLKKEVIKRDIVQAVGNKKGERYFDKYIEKVTGESVD